MLTFYFNLAPNPMKVALLLEELGVAYETVPVDTRKGEQFAEDFVRINPNAKLPAIVDDGVRVFDSNAILLYLGDKHGRFCPPPGDLKGRGELLSWLMFIASGIGPYSGQAVHFRHNVPKPEPYALNRYDFEAGRHWNIIEQRLSENRYMLGAEYSIVDMCLWGWARMVPYVMGDDNIWTKFPQIRRLLDEINARPAAARVQELRGKYKFKTEMDDEARAFMYRHLARSEKT